MCMVKSMTSPELFSMNVTFHNHWDCFLTEYLTAGVSKRRADITYDVSPLTIYFVHGIVACFQIPIVQNRHHHAQPIEFSGIHEMDS